MHHVPLILDLAANGHAATGSPGAIVVPRTDLARPEPTALAEFARRQGLSLFQALALTLKLDWEHARQAGRKDRSTSVPRVDQSTDAEVQQANTGDLGSVSWAPWQNPARYVALFAAFADCPSEDPMTLLLLEQSALGCHHLSAQDVAKLAARHARSTEMLDAAPPETQKIFSADKREWLLQEFELTGLIEMRQRLVDAMESARIAFLAITADAYATMIAAGHKLALWRYRRHFGDVTMTLQEVTALLALEQDLGVDGTGAVPLEPELHAALRDSVEEVASDQRVMREMSLLIASGGVEPASEEDQRQAADLFRKLARIHPDALSRHPEYASISPENQRRLSEIWTEASATHRVRVYLARRKLLSYVQNLESWQREVNRILRHLTFHDPGKLVEGNTLDEQWAFVKAARAEVQHQLHAVRDDLAQLQLDPRHDQHLRVVGLSEQEREAERASMFERAQAWNDEAAQIEAQMLATAAADAQADAVRLKGQRK
jgi:hypothetical protein